MKAQKRSRITGKSGFWLGCLGVAVFLCSFATQSAQASRLVRFLYVADPGTNQILAYSIIPTNGKLVRLSCYSMPDIDSPIAAVVDRDGAFLYVANKLPATGPTIGVYSINLATGCLSFVTSYSMLSGAVPFAMGITAHDLYLYVSDSTGNVYGWVNDPPGTLTPVVGSPFPAGPAPVAGLAVDTIGSFLYTSNDIATGAISEFTYGAGGVLPAPTSYTAGVQSYPFQLALDPVGQCLLATADTAVGGVSSYSINPITGALTNVSNMPTGTSPFGVAVTPVNQVAYVANTGSNNVSGYLVAPSTCILTQITGSPWLTGGSSTTPAGIAIDPSGKYVYVADMNGYVSGYSMNEITGVLTPTGASPYPTTGIGTSPLAIAIQP